MRISLVSEHANPLAALGGADAGGQNVHVAALAAGLARRGHEVVVHTRRDSVSAPERLATPDGYVVHHVPAGPPTDVPKDDLLPYMSELGRRLRATWAQQPPDVVHAHFWMSGLASLDAVRGTGIPLLQTFHALGSVKRRHQGRHDTSPAARVGVEQRLCREVDRVIATCRDEVDELRALGLPPYRAEVIPCGVDTELFCPGPAPQIEAPSGRHRLVVVGRLVTRKGIDDVIEALARLVRHDHDVELVIAGGPPGGPSGRGLEVDPEVQRLRTLADRLRVADRVTFVGGMARTDVPDLMRSADVVVTVPWYEPFGIVPLEAMACGRPIVGSAVGGLLDTIVPGTTGELVPPRDPRALAEALHRLLDDPERRAYYGAAGRERAVGHYDWGCVVARTEAVYEEAVHSRTLTAKEVAQ